MFQTAESSTWFITLWVVSFVLKIAGEITFSNTMTRKSYVSTTLFSIGFSFIVSVLVWLLFYLSGHWISMKASTFDFVFYSITMVIYRLIVLTADKKRKASITIVATEKEAETIMKKLIDGRNKFKKVDMYIINECKENLDDLKEIICKTDSVIVGKEINEANKNDILLFANADEYAFKITSMVPQDYAIIATRPDVSRADDLLLQETQPLKFSLSQRFVKRSFDIFASLLGLIILSPVIGITALAIWLQDKGPAIYKQERVGKSGRVFTLYKFRSMVVDAESKTGAVLMKDKDNRLTKVGKFIRATRLDELPQLWNILKGDMSVVGPRPERPVFVEKFLKETPDYKYRHNVKPGLTGYAQVRGNYHTDYRDKLKWDLLYIRKCSVSLDLGIMILTVLAVFDKRSASGTEEYVDLESYLAKAGYTLTKYGDHWTVTK